MPELPGDVVNSIVDLLKADKADLLTCALISRQWLSRSRQHRFSSVSLLIGWNPEDRKTLDRVQAFMALISSPLVTFIPFVTKVQLSHVRDRRKKRPQIISPGEILAKMDACGIRPTHLYLNCLRHFTHPFDGAPAFASSLTHLTIQFNMNHVVFRSVVDYICAFPLLESVTMWGIPEVLTPTQPKSVALPPRLHTMRTGHPMLADWILTLNPIPRQIISLGLLNFGRLWVKWPEINRYLDSPAVEDVQSLTFSGSASEPGYDVGPHLHRFRCLKNLVICESHTFCPTTLLSVLDILRSSPASRTLETITLTLEFLTTTGYATPTWLKLDAVLAEPTSWPRLRSLTLTTDDEEDPEYSLVYFLGVLAFDAGLDCPITVALRRHLPQCEQRGMLSVVGIPVVHPTHASN